MNDENQITERRPNGTLRVRTLNTEPTKTQQQFADECDINNIMRKYSSTGEFTVLTKKGGVYGDFSEIQDFQGMLDTVRYAQEAFASLPATVRLRFQNDPGQLLAFVQDPKNYDEGVKLGLVEPKTENQMPAINENKLNKNDEAASKIKTKKAPVTDEVDE